MIEKLLEALDAVNGQALRREIRILKEEREGLYSFCPIKEGSLTVLTRGCYHDGDVPNGAYWSDDSLRTGSTGVVREVCWTPAKDGKPGRFYCMWEPTLKWGRYSDDFQGMDPANGSYLRSTGSTYFVAADRLEKCDDPYPWRVACRDCDWHGPPPAPVDGRNRGPCSGCGNTHSKIEGLYRKTLYVVTWPGLTGPKQASDK